MRILIVSDAWHPQVNGVVRTLDRVAHGLRILGDQVEIVGPDRFFNLPCPGYAEIRLAWFPHRRLYKMIDDFAPNALHIATEGPLGQAARAYALRHGLRFTTGWHTRFPEYVKARTGLPLSATYAWLRRFHAPSQAVLTPTPSMAQTLVARGFSNVKIWGRGVDTDCFRPEPSQVFDHLPRPVHLYVGRIAVEKNLSAFLGLNLPGSKVVVGDGPARASLMTRHPDAHFLGPKFGAELARHYAAADVFVFPSLTDTFGLVLLEALACGLPVAAYPVTGPADVLSDGQGKVAALEDDLGRAVARALTLDRSAARAYAQRFSWDEIVAQFRATLVPKGDVRSARPTGAIAA